MYCTNTSTNYLVYYKSAPIDRYGKKNLVDKLYIEEFITKIIGAVNYVTINTSYFYFL